MKAARVLVLTASVGAGHDGPAHEIARQLRADGHVAVVTDLILVGPGGRVLRGLFRLILTVAPRWWGSMFDSYGDVASLPRPIRALIAATGAALARTLDQERIDLVVGTFPLAAPVAHAARRRSGRAVRIAVYVTDPAVHPLWIHPAVDLFLTTWTFGPAQIATRSGAPVAVVAPAVRPQFRTPQPGSAAATRLALGLPHAPLALVASGSWAVGDVLGTVRDLLRDSEVVPVVVCGRNRRLRRRVGRVPGAVALGWVDDMAGLMRACTVAVINSGGLTLAEAATVGLPVVHHRPLPGQGVSNADICAVALGSASAPLPDALAAARRATDWLGGGDILTALLPATDSEAVA